MHAVNVIPEVTDFDDEGYSIVLKGTAGLGSAARGWFKTKVAWWPSEAVAGEDILLDVPRATSSPAAAGTVFDAALYWAEWPRQSRATMDRHVPRQRHVVRTGPGGGK